MSPLKPFHRLHPQVDKSFPSESAAMLAIRDDIRKLAVPGRRTLLDRRWHLFGPLQPLELTAGLRRIDQGRFEPHRNQLLVGRELHRPPCARSAVLQHPSESHIDRPRGARLRWPATSKARINFDPIAEEFQRDRVEIFGRRGCR